jgi:hypothetical protein
LSADSTMAYRRETRNVPHLILLLSTIIFLTQGFPVFSADSRHFATVPALGVLADGQTGIVHYIVLQIDNDPQRGGPIVQFNEINLGGGSIVSEDWKEGVKQAVVAATRAVGGDGRHRSSLARRQHQIRRRPDRENHAGRSDRARRRFARQNRDGGPIKV